MHTYQVGPVRVHGPAVDNGQLAVLARLAFGHVAISLGEVLLLSLMLTFP